MKNAKEVEAMQYWQQRNPRPVETPAKRNNLLANVVGFVLSFVTVFTLANYLLGVN
jgi:cytochrome c biogenesis protein CcdA